MQTNLAAAIEVGVAHDVGARFLDRQQHGVDIFGGQRCRATGSLHEAPNAVKLTLVGGKLRNHLPYYTSTSEGHLES